MTVGQLVAKLAEMEQDAPVRVLVDDLVWEEVGTVEAGMHDGHLAVFLLD